MKYEFRFPDIGEGIAEGVLSEWLVEKGDMINEGDSLAEIETDKVTTEIPSPRTGKVLDLKFKPGETIYVGDVFVTIDTSGGSLEEAEDIVEEEVMEEETAGVVGEVVASSEVIPSSTEGYEEIKKVERREKALATPVARKMAKDLGIDINTISGTGLAGRVMKEDIQKAYDSKSQEVEVEKKEPVDKEENIERIPLTKIRQTISTQMTKSRFTIPHTTAMDQIEISKLDEFRKKYKEILIDEGVSLTYMPFIIKAVIVALKRHPEFNSSYDEENQEMLLKKDYHMGIATDTDRGLMVPVIRDVDKKSIVEIANEIVDLSERAKNNKLDIHELRGSTFTITNYGSIGGLFGIPIINYPESAILGVGRIVKKPVVKNDEIVVGKVLPLSLSYDHRIIDGASGARFLNTLAELLADPEILLLKS